MGRYTGKKCRLFTMVGLTCIFFLVEIVTGYVTNSMALVADSFHMLSDIVALIVALISVQMAPKLWSKNTFGWARAEVLGALVNAVFLVALCFSITVESLKRFYDPEDIHDPQMILIVGVLGLVVNVLGLFMFAGHGHSHGGGGHGHSHGTSGGRGTHRHLADLADDEDLDDDNEEKAAMKPKSIEDGTANAAAHSHNNGTKEAKGDKKDKAKKQEGSGSQMNMRGVFLHVLADALGSVVVIISALIMWQTEWEYKIYVDPALSILLVCIMMKTTWPLLIESGMILLQTVPTHIDVDKMKRGLLENTDGVLAVHEFHVWQLTGDRIIASAHIRCLNLSEYMKIAENVKEFFHNEGIHSTTIQPEFVESQDPSAAGSIAMEDCAIGCPKDPDTQDQPSCQANKCCPPTTSKSTQNTPLTERRAETETELGNGESNPKPSTGTNSPNAGASSRRSAPNLSSALKAGDADNINGIQDGDLDDLSATNGGNNVDDNDQATNGEGAKDNGNDSSSSSEFIPKPQGGGGRVVRVVSKKPKV